MPPSPRPPLRPAVREMCDCIETVNAKLAPDHTLNCTMAFRTGEISRPMIDLIRHPEWKRETRRGKPGFMVASHCPFCGEKYVETMASDAAINRATGQ